MITIILIAVTSIISISAFNNPVLVNRFIFYPPQVKNGQWYRLISYGFLHADWAHLIFNMYALYLFGTAIENAFLSFFGNTLGAILYLLLYFLGLLVSIIPTYLKEKNNAYYRGLGASGAISAVVFAYILIYPMSYMGIIFIPVYIPAFIFGALYVGISVYFDRKQLGSINHLAHISGGIFGLIFMIVVFNLIGHYNIIEHFIQNIRLDSMGDLFKVGL